MSKKRFKSAVKKTKKVSAKSCQRKTDDQKFKEAFSFFEKSSASSHHSLALGIYRAVTGKTPGENFDCGARACQLCAPNRQIDWKEIEEIWNKVGKKK